MVRSDARKLVHIRAGRKVTVAVHNRWEWVAATGSAQIFGPDDPLPGDPVDGFDTAPVPALLRSVFQSAGGTHDDWDAYDRVMCEEHRAAVFVLLDRLYGTMRG